MAAKKIVIVFAQLTPKLLDDMFAMGYTHEDGSLTGDVIILLSTPPFNVKLADTDTRIKTLLEQTIKLNRAYNMPAYGDAIQELVAHPIATESVVPYYLGLDEFVIKKAQIAWASVAKWLLSTEEPNPCITAAAGSKFMDEAMQFITNSTNSTNSTDTNAKQFTVARWNEWLNGSLGADWRKQSENLHVSKFLRLFGATDDTLELFAKSSGLLNQARWVAKFIQLFKPTNKFNAGAVSDMINFMAMFQDTPRPMATAQLTDQDSARAIKNFNPNLGEFKLIERAYFDMEPDDLAVMTYIKKKTNASICRMYPNDTIAKHAENMLLVPMQFTLADDIIIDEALQNAEALQFYMPHAATTRH